VDRLTSLELANWGALYLATGLCCALAATLASVVLALALAQERPWRDIRSLRAAALLLPRTWWRWQKLYLLSTPVTLGVVGSFALSLSW
jgi:hypothetical protein